MMDGTGPFRPAPGVSIQPAPRHSTEQDTSALPREQTVTPTGRSLDNSRTGQNSADQTSAHAQGQRRKINDSDDAAAKTSRSIEIDPETRDVLLKVVDQSTGEVTWQVPAEKIMNMRIYAEQVARENERAMEMDARAAPDHIDAAV